MDLAVMKTVIENAWYLLFGGGKDATLFAGVIPMFITFLGANPILLLPLGFYIIFLGIGSVRKLIRGY